MTKGLSGFLKSELDELKLRIAAEAVAHFSTTDIRAQILRNLERWRLQGTWGPAYDEWNRLATEANDETLVQVMLGQMPAEPCLN